MESKLNTYRSWLSFLQKVEAFFTEKSFLKVKTPNLVPSGAMESSLHTLKIEDSDFELPTSPEFALKKLWLSGLADKIFEISPSFRAEELGNQHLAEFTMLEFYISGLELTDLHTLTRDFLSKMLGCETSSLCTLRVDEVFRTMLGFELRPDSNKEFLEQVAAFHGVRIPEQSSWSDVFHVLFLEKIEPLLSNGFLALTHYPPQLAALAQIDSDGWSERVEFYYNGIELGNGYNELLDADELEKRWCVENQTRKDERREPHKVDKGLIEIHEKTHVKKGVGMAIGLERLFWLTQTAAAEHIEVWPFGG